MNEQRKKINEDAEDISEKEEVIETAQLKQVFAELGDEVDSKSLFALVQQADPEAEGVIKVEPHRGPFVATLSRDQAEGVYQVRLGLEGLACRLFAEKATDAQRQALKDAFKELQAASRRPDSQARLRAKNQFYTCLLVGAQNEALGSCLHILNSRISLLRATSMKAPGRIKESIA